MLLVLVVLTTVELTLRDHSRSKMLFDDEHAHVKLEIYLTIYWPYGYRHLFEESGCKVSSIGRNECNKKYTNE